MTRLREFASRIRALFGKSRLDQDLDEELRAHIEMLVEENVRRGMSVEAARYAARRSFGGIEQTKEAYRDQRGLPIVETLLQDIRYGFRMLRKNPGFTAVAVLTLALGIGANTAIFSVVDAVMLEMLPVRSPQQLLQCKWTAKAWPSVVEDLEGSNRKDPASGGWISESFPYPAFEAMRTRSTSSSEVFAFAANLPTFNVQFDGKADSASCQPVSGNYFNGLGVQTVLGRPILPSDDAAAAPPVAVLSFSFWQRKLGADESVVGKSIVVDSIPLTIAGVAPPEFFGTQPGSSVDVWVTLHVFPRLLQSVTYAGPAQYGGDADAAAAAYWEKAGTWWLIVMGRLKPGVSETQARAELEVIFDQGIDAAAKSAKQDENRPTLLTAPGGQGLDQLRRQFSQPLLVLVGAVGLVLLIACANVAGLLLARATARQKEIAVRLSLGARRLRLIQQLLTESVLLAAIGGLLGFLFARWFSELLVALVASGRERITLPLHVNERVLIFTAGIALLTGVLFGLAPAFSATRMSLTSALKEGGANVLGARRSRLVKGLVSAQVALSLLLLVGAGLFLRTLQKLQSVPLGFERQQLLLFSVSPGLNGYKGARLAEYYREVQRRVAGITGVGSVSFSSHGPVGYGESSSSITIPGVTTDKQRVDVHRLIVGPGYFDTLGIPMLTGRMLSERDDTSAPKVAVVNDALVREAFGGDSPLGKILRFGSPPRNRDFEIVGVVGDAKYNDLRKSPPPTAYFSHLQTLDAATNMTFEVRTGGDPNLVVSALRNETAEVDKNIPISRVETLTQAIDRALLFERMFSQLTGFFGLLALVLVCVGLYGTMSYFVARQTNEIGIRMALGAQPVRVFRMVVTQGLKLTAAGVVAGLAGAAAATRLIASVLYEVPALDPLTFVSVGGLLIAVGLFACYVPARRAMKVDPMVALRYE
jgi:predicted permease